MRGSVTLHRNLLPLLATIKHPSFSDEEEWRVILGEDSEGRSESFRVSRFGITPYVEMAFEPVAVREVIVGPSVHQDLRASGVRRLLTRYQYDSTDVYVTDSPFRT
jgi:hypothetical protein